MTGLRVPGSVDAARALDEGDELGVFRTRFVPIADGGVVAYLDGNSLGRPARSIVDRLNDLVAVQWGSRMIRSWEEGWLELPEEVGDRLGEACLGAGNGQVVLGDSTTVWLYKALRVAAGMRPGRTEIVTDALNFPTDRYVVEGVAAELGLTVRWVETDLAAGVTVEALARVVSERTAVVTLSHVAYRSGYLADLAAINELVHGVGALIVWDVCHSAGVVDVRLDAAATDFAVGCTYKFLNSGPGAPSFLYVNEKHLPEFRQPLRGWMSTADIFDMDANYQPAHGIRRALSGTPPVIGLVCVAEGVAMIAEAGIGRIRAKSVALTRLAIELADDWLAPLGFTLGSPREDERRGGHLTVNHPDAQRLARVFIDHGVIVDFRAPHGVRIGLSPLSTGYAELWMAMSLMRDLTRAG
jgi:kynureninase